MLAYQYYQPPCGREIEQIINFNINFLLISRALHGYNCDIQSHSLLFYHFQKPYKTGHTRPSSLILRSGAPFYFLS